MLIGVSCEKPSEKKYHRYFDLDKETVTKKLFSTRKKVVLPLLKNKIYDPFHKKVDSLSFHKNQYTFPESFSNDRLKIKVLNRSKTNVDVSTRLNKSDTVKGYPILIKNLSKKDTCAIRLFRGSAVMVQEAYHKKKKKWIPLERFSRAKVGYHFYSIYPGEYIYTKVPHYKGEKTAKLRLKIQLTDTSFMYSNNYYGYVPKRWLR